MSGHGHVVPNADGTKARCGGPALCRECALEAVRVKTESEYSQNILTVPVTGGAMPGFVSYALTQERKSRARLMGAFILPLPDSPLLWLAECTIQLEQLVATLQKHYQIQVDHVKEHERLVVKLRRENAHLIAKVEEAVLAERNACADIAGPFAHLAQLIRSRPSPSLPAGGAV